MPKGVGYPGKSGKKKVSVKKKKGSHKNSRNIKRTKKGT